MKKIKDPALFEKIRKFLTEDMPVLRKKSPNTVEAYRYTLNIYLVFLCEKHSKSLYNITVKDFSQKNILFFLDWLIEERGNKASTANLRLRHIKRFCRFLMDENILMISELSAIQKIAEIPNASEDTIKFLTIQETKLILSQPDTSKAIGIRDSLFMYLLYDSGCRIQEILSLKLKDFFVQNGTAELHIIGKGNKFRITPISEELIPKFERYCRHYHKSSTYDDYLFYTKRRGACSQMSCDTAQTFIKKYGIMAQKLNSAIPHVHPHLFRHTRAMHLYMAGMPLELVSQWLGHSQLETSLIYARATTDMKRKAVDKISAKENSVYKSFCFIAVFFALNALLFQKLFIEPLYLQRGIARASGQSYQRIDSCGGGLCRASFPSFDSVYQAAAGASGLPPLSYPQAAGSTAKLTGSTNTRLFFEKEFL
ncbi:tyrosine-type recombinase/integrase [Oscillibacter sp.]|uniref:tyrosine-type recombinase/integrase n=1 Tax=Oscillibacter sp. TaxID=1945593 RepID=UPI00258955F0|nr:tyrosine-type recombinase/integrase [Oscillibacter sp.]